MKIRLLILLLIVSNTIDNASAMKRTRDDKKSEREQRLEARRRRIEQGTEAAPAPASASAAGSLIAASAAPASASGASVAASAAAEAPTTVSVSGPSASEEIETIKECYICQDNFDIAETDAAGLPIHNFRKLICNHFFHTACIEDWFNLSNTCPVCRTVQPGIAAPLPAAQDEQEALEGVLGVLANDQEPAGARIIITDRNDLLLVAIAIENEDLVRNAIEEHRADPNHISIDPDGDEITPLLAAANKSNTAIIRILLAHRANPNVIFLNTTPLLALIDSSDNAEAAQELIAAGADINKKGGAPYFQSPIITASALNRHQILQLLMNRPNLHINAQDEQGGTALYFAAKNGHTEIVRTLLKHYAINTTLRTNPEHGALRALDVAANVEIRTLIQKHMNKKLLRAAQAGDIDRIQQLLAAGADIETKNKEGETALFIASREDRPVVVQTLINAGANVHALTKSKSTPLTIAASCGRTPSAEALLRAGAHINAPNKDNITPLHMAAAWNKLATTQYLIRRGADVNIPSNDGQTPLHRAIAKGFFDIARTLIGAGANIHAVNKKGETPLNSIRYVGPHASTYESCINLLLGKGADINTRDLKGKTPLHKIAKTSNDSDLSFISFVLSIAGIDPTITNAEGQTAADVAITPKVKGLIQQRIDALASHPAPSSEGTSE